MIVRKIGIDVTNTIDLKGIQDGLLQHLSAAVEDIRNTEMPTSVTTYTITASAMKDRSFIEQLANQLPRQGGYMYWFKVDEPSTLLEQFEKRRSDYSCKCARDNKNQDSEYVYVGSCTKTKLGSRFRQHCGWGNDQTYSLQLRKWLNDDELVFTFSYVEFKHSLVIQYLEDQMHREWKPLFGKPGSSGKLQKLA